MYSYSYVVYIHKTMYYVLPKYLFKYLITPTRVNCKMWNHELAHDDLYNVQCYLQCVIVYFGCNLSEWRHGKLRTWVERFQETAHTDDFHSMQIQGILVNIDRIVLYFVIFMTSEEAAQSKQ